MTFSKALVVEHQLYHVYVKWVFDFGNNLLLLLRLKK